VNDVDILDPNIKLPFSGLKQYFGGFAFKYQKQPKDLTAAAKIAAHYFDVVVTSGKATGYAADIEKVRTIKEAIGDTPLALASGVTEDNVNEYLPYVDIFIVGTSLQISPHDIFMYDAKKVATLAQLIHSFV
jgi:predicted TIM-barrel enzyme